MQVDKYDLYQDMVSDYMLPAGATPITITAPVSEGYAGTLWYADPMSAEHGDPVHLRVYTMRGTHGWIEGNPTFGGAITDSFGKQILFFWSVIP